MGIYVNLEQEGCERYNINLEKLLHNAKGLKCLKRGTIILAVRSAYYSRGDDGFCRGYHHLREFGLL